MTDITMCAGGSCPKKQDCYRHTANPSYLQTYFVNAPYDVQSHDCNYFINNRPREKDNETKD
jgi:hypothetical protein